MTPEELQRQLEEAKARADRLEAELTRAKSEGQSAEQMQALQAKLTTAEASLATLNGELSSLKASIKADGKVDVEAIIASTVASTRAAFEPQIKQLQSDLARTEADRKKTLLDSHRARKISEAAASGLSAEMLEALVTRDAADVAAIDSSVANASALIRKNIPAAQPQGQGNQQAAGSQFAPPPGSNGGNGNTGESDEQFLARVKEMSPAEFAANRIKLKQLAAKRVASANPLAS